MQAPLILLTLLSLCACAITDHSVDINHGNTATSYQSVNFQHFHPVPTYIKKEDKQLVDDPIPAGASSFKLEIHHGDKNNPGSGYSVSTSSDDSYVFKIGDSNDSEEKQNPKEEETRGGYEVQETYHQQEDEQKIYPHQFTLQQEEQQRLYQFVSGAVQPNQEQQQQQQQSEYSDYYSYPHESLQLDALQQHPLHQQPIFVDDKNHDDYHDDNS